MKKLTTILISGLAVAAVSGCATISEEDCVAGNWAEMGYSDGVNGKSSSRIAKIADKCGEFGVRPNREVYLENHSRGVVLYCTYERGYEAGENGNSYNQVCSGPLAVDYEPGYDSGRAVYEIISEHKSLIAEHDRALDDLAETRQRLAEEELTPEGRKKLLKREIRQESDVEELRIDIRAFERIHDLPRYDFGY